MMKGPETEIMEERIPQVGIPDIKDGHLASAHCTEC